MIRHDPLNDRELIAHTLRVPLPPDGRPVYDIGAGIRPYLGLGKPVCVEPCEAYAAVLRDSGYQVIESTALEALEALDPHSTVLLLDVIEHMEKTEGEAVRDAMLEFDRAVIYTPYGFMPQETDNWGLGQHGWQTHRSGWLPEEFPGWWIKRRKSGQNEAFWCCRS